MNADRTLLLLYLDGDLPDDEVRALQQRLVDEPALQSQLDRLGVLRHTLATSVPDSFAPFFSERVMRRLVPQSQQSPAESLYESLRWLFVRTALACLLVVAVLSIYNAISYDELAVTSSLTEAIFGLPSTDLFDAIYGI